MTPAEIREEVLDILSDIAPDEDLSNLDDNVNFREQLELDSMDFLDIVMELRKRYRVQIPEDDYVNLASMSTTVAYLEPLMKDIEREKV
ncbi:MAG TPA: acyl carrier protein [Lacipirellulaceae bacterium]|jgi:acyl carrier protein|nr:acyl carrier protein [Lacipirellulaceae bacterium]